VTVWFVSHTLSGCRRASPELSGNLDKVRGHRRNPALGTCNSVCGSVGARFEPKSTRLKLRKIIVNVISTLVFIVITIFTPKQRLTLRKG
jgi:hypothetical protein